MSRGADGSKRAVVYATQHEDVGAADLGPLNGTRFLLRSTRQKMTGLVRGSDHLAALSNSAEVTAGGRTLRLSHVSRAVGSEVVGGIDLTAAPDAGSVRVLRTALLRRRVLFWRSYSIDELSTAHMVEWGQ